jgi:hypothetical protein
MQFEVIYHFIIYLHSSKMKKKKKEKKIFFFLNTKINLSSF